MQKIPRHFILPAVAALGLFCTAHACQIPVYRYALERWQADPFQITVLQRGDLNTDQKQAFDLLSPKDAKQAPPNAEARQVDLLRAPDPTALQLWESIGKPELPCVVAQFPASDKVTAPAWMGPLTSDAMKGLLDSPARREIARRILKGESAVWVLVEGSDPKAAAATAEMVVAQLKKNEENLKLPEPDNGDPSSQMSSQLPLKIGFSLLRVRADDPAEKAFIAMLRQSSREPLPVDAGIVAYPIFGRGRCLGAIPAKDLTPGVIEQICSFLTGACSCQVKNQNPGVDLLMAVNWEDFLFGSLVVDKELPPLTGLMPAAPVVASGTNHPAVPAVQAAPPAPVTPPARNLKRNVIVFIGAGVILVLGVAFLIGRRKG